MKPPPRLHLDRDLPIGTSVTLGADQAHYLKSVLRLGPGAPVNLFNARSGEVLARLETLGKSVATATIAEQVRPPLDAPEGPWLLFPPLKRARVDLLVEKATELGVGRLVPVFTRRTDAERVKLERLKAHAVEAAEQCERLDVPELVTPRKLDACLSDWPEDRALVVAAERSGAAPVGLEIDALAGRPLAFLVGPEGGFEQNELDRLRNLPFVSTVSLGATILRAETAALALLAVWQSRAGAWTEQPVF